jgi:hypothetical protein
MHVRACSLVAIAAVVWVKVALTAQFIQASKVREEEGAHYQSHVDAVHQDPNREA